MNPTRLTPDQRATLIDLLEEDGVTAEQIVAEMNFFISGQPYQNGIVNTLDDLIKPA